ncbi:hypothetical protein D3C84_1031180 [compost metagenome]
MHTRGKIRLGTVEPRPLLLGAARVASDTQHLRIIRREHTFALRRARCTEQNPSRHRRCTGFAQQAAILAQAEA